jgi:hypothetical protein
MVDISDKDADAVLASLIRRFLPDPLSERAQLALSDLTADELKIFRQFAAELRHTAEEIVESPNLKTQMLTKMSAALSERVLAGGRGQAAAQRLGSRGELRPGLYKVKFERSERWEYISGVRKAHVEDAIRQPDAIEHVHLPDDSPFPRLTLVARRIQPKRNAPFITLIQAERKEDVLDVRAAWRIPETLPFLTMRQGGDDAERYTLLALLRAFVDEFGVDLHLPNRPPTKFIVNEAIPLEHTSIEQLLSNALNVKSQEFGLEFHLVSLVRVSRLNVAEIALCYAVELKKYWKALQESGVR